MRNWLACFFAFLLFNLSLGSLSALGSGRITPSLIPMERDKTEAPIGQADSNSGNETDSSGEEVKADNALYDFVKYALHDLPKMSNTRLPETSCARPCSLGCPIERPPKTLLI